MWKCLVNCNVINIIQPGLEELTLESGRQGCSLHIVLEKSPSLRYSGPQLHSNISYYKSEKCSAWFTQFGLSSSSWHVSLPHGKWRWHQHSLSKVGSEAQMSPGRTRKGWLAGRLPWVLTAGMAEEKRKEQEEQLKWHMCVKLSTSVGHWWQFSHSPDAREPLECSGQSGPFSVLRGIMSTMAFCQAQFLGLSFFLCCFR